MITTYPENVISIDYAHQKTHEGRYFSGGYYNSSLADTASVMLLVQMGATYALHSKISATVTGNCTLYIFEDTTFSAAGTGVTMANHNRSSSKVFSGTVTHTPTITADGTQLNGTELLPGGGKHSSGGVEGGFSNEFILATSKNYMIRCTNVSGGAIKVSIGIEGYQPTL